MSCNFVNKESMGFHFVGAREFTSTQCILGTSSRELRTLTESGDVIRYVFLRSAGLSDSLLVGGGGCGPVSLCRDSGI